MTPHYVETHTHPHTNTHMHWRTHAHTLSLSLARSPVPPPRLLLPAKSWGLLNWFPRGALRQTVWWECWAVMSPQPTQPPYNHTPFFFFLATGGPNWSEPGQKDALMRFQTQTSWWTRSGCSARARRPGVLVLLGGTLAVWAQRNTRPLRSTLQNMCSCTWQPLNPVKLMDGPLTLECISPLFPLL